MERQQNPQLLSMIGLGTTSGQRRADGSLMEAGVHLRWQMGEEMGFPPGGFDLYRREQNLDQFLRCGYAVPTPVAGEIAWVPKEAGHIPLKVQITASGEVTPIEPCDLVNGVLLPGEQTLRMDFKEPIRHLRITLDEQTIPTPRAAAFWKSGDGEVLVAQARGQRQANQEWRLRLFADQIDTVILQGEDLMPCEICVVLVEDGYDWDWGQIPLNGDTPIYLPITHPEWDSPHVHSPDDHAEAKARLPASLPYEQLLKYVRGFDADLHDILYDLVGTQSQRLYQLTEQDEKDGALMQWPGMQLLKLAALDPNLARILGLYWHDEPPDPDQYYDYRLVAYYEKKLFPGRHYKYSALEVGRRYGFLLRHDDLIYGSPNPIEVERAEWDGSEWNALSVGSTIPGAPFVIRLPEPAASATLVLQAEAKLTVKGLLGTQEVDKRTVAAGGRTPDLENPAGIDVIVIETEADFKLFEIVLRKNAGALEDVVYTSFHHCVEGPPAIDAPELEPPAVLPTRTGIGVDGALSANQSSVGLRWSLPVSGGNSLLPNAPIFYHVQRADLGNLEQPEPPTAETLLNEVAPTLVTQSHASQVSGADENRSYYTDRDLPEGWYGYQVRGIDIFGRLGEWSQAETVQIIERLAPPTPQAVSAEYLDPADPWLSQEDKDWALANGLGLRVSWEWSGLLRLQAPDIAPPGAEFRIYVVMGELNTLTGSVRQVNDAGAASTLETDLTWSGAPDALAGESIRVGANFFEVNGSGSGEDCTILVNNLSAPDLAPEPGPCTLVLSPDRAYWRDYKISGSWEMRLHTVPAADIPIVTGEVVSVIDYQPNAAAQPGATRTVITNQVLADADGMLIPGALLCDGIVYRAYGHALDPLEIHIAPYLSPTDSNLLIEPPAGAQFTYYPGKKYEALIADFTIPVDPAKGTASAHVALSCSDGNRRIADDPIWDAPGRGGLGSRPGNEGPLSNACRVMAVNRSSPAAPGNVPAADEPIFARPANFYGQAKYTLAWEPAADAAGYAVYRCSGATFCDHDLKQWREQNDYYANPDEAYADDLARLTAWLASYDPALTTGELLSDPEAHLEVWKAWGQAFYPGLTDAEIQARADRPGSEKAFSRVNTEPATGVTYTDAFDGRGQGFYLYRVRALDAADNYGAWSATYPPVHIFDVTPPARPIITSTLSSEQSIHLTWRANVEKDLQGYWLWLSESPEEIFDVRRLAPAIVTGPSSGNSDESFSIEDLIGGQDYYFRLAAVDLNGNVSEPTPVQTARPIDTGFPAPPVFTEALWQGSDPDLEIRLAWEPPQANSQILVQRCTGSSPSWTSLSNWLPSDNQGYTDNTARPHQSYTYRIQVKSAVGLLNQDFNVITVQALYP